MSARECHEFRAAVARLFEGSAAALDDALRAHWLDCPECRAHFAQEQALEELLRSDRAAAPGGIAATVLASLAPLRAEALREQALDDLLDAVVVAAPAGTAQRVLAGLAPVRARERRATVVKRTLIGVAVAAAAVLLVWRWSARSEPERLAPPELVDAPVEPALEDDQELLAYALEHWDLLTDDDVDLWLASLDPVDQARIELLGAEGLDDQPAGDAPEVRKP